MSDGRCFFALYFHCALYFTSGCFFMLFVPDDLADAICSDKAADGILYADDIAIYCRFDLAVFKREVAILGQAVVKDKIFAIAEGLGALDMTTDEVQILGIPAEIFSLDDAVVNNNVLGVPEGVLGLEMGISDLDVFDVLEGILAREGKLGKLHILALKKWILGVNGGVFDGNIRASPAELRAIDVALGKLFNARLKLDGDKVVFDFK